MAKKEQSQEKFEDKEMVEESESNQSNQPKQPKIEITEMSQAPEVEVITDSKPEIKVDENKESESTETLENKGNSSDSKNLLIMAAVVIGVFAIVFFGFRYYNDNLTGAVVLSVEEMHQLNFEGKLSEDEGVLYNGYSFVQADGLWWTDILVSEDIALRVPLHFNPKEVEHIPVTGTLAGDFYKGENVYTTINPETSNGYYALALSEFNINLAQGVKRRPVVACTKEDPICEDREILSCENTLGKPVVEFVISEEAKVELSGTCIKISGDGEELIKAADRILFGFYGIMD